MTVKKKSKTQLSTEKALNDLSKKNENYLTIIKTTKNLECYNIVDKINDYYNAETIKNWLESGMLNLIQHAVVESHIWVVDREGKRIAILSKQGGDSLEDIKIEIA